MHELGIAQQLIDTAITLMPPDAGRVAALRVQVGALAGVSAEELRFGFEVMSQSTPCADAELILEMVPAIAHCAQCDGDYSVGNNDSLQCPTCSSSVMKVVQGKDLIITSLDVVSEEVINEAING